MPLFDFRCNACGKEFELLIMGSRKPECPHCQAKDVTKLMSRFAVKGSSSGSGSSGGSCSSCAGGHCSSCH